MASIDQLSIEIEASAKKAMPELDNLIKKLSTLGATLSLIGSTEFKAFNAGTNRATKNIGKLQQSINSIDTTKLDKLADSMGRLSKTGNFGMTIRNTSSSMNKGMGQLGKKVASFGASVGKGVLTAPYKAMATGMKGVATASVGAAKGLKTFFSSSGAVGTSAKNLVQYFASLYARVWALRRVLSSAMTGIQSSMDLVETYHYFETVYDKIGKESKQAWADYGYESAEAYAQSFRDRALQLNEKMSGVSFDSEGNPTYTGTKSLGLDADLVMQYQAQYAQQAYGIGMVGEAAEATSRALTMLAGDWSSLRNISFEQSYSKMASALAGQSRAVRSLGIDITQAALAQTAANLGIEASISKMNQAQKAELRMIAILEQSRVAWGDLAKTLNTPANQMRMLEQNLKSLARTIGSLFLPIVAKVLPYINGLVIALQRLFQWLGKLLGVSGAGSIASQGGMGDLGDDFEDLADSAEDAQEEAEELKNTILAFDELNVLNDPNKNKKDKETGMSAAEQALLDQSLLDLLDEYEKAWNEAWARMQSKAQEIADKLTEVGKKILDFIHNGDWANLGKYLADGINQGLEKLYNLLKWENVKGRIEPFVTGFAKTLNSLIDNVDFDLIGRILGAGLNTLVNTMNLWYENFDFINLGKKLAEGIRGMIDEIDWLALGHYFGNKFMSLWYTLYGLVMNFPFEELGTSLGTMLNGMLERVNFAVIGDTIAEAFNGAFRTLKAAVEEFNWIELALKLKSGINHFVHRVNLEEAASSIAGFLNNAIHTMILTLQGNWPEKLASKFNRGLDRFINEFKFDQVGQALRLAVDHLILILYDFVQDESRFKKLGAKFASMINSFLAPKKTALREGKLGEALGAAFNDFFAFIDGLINGTDEENGIDWDALKETLKTNVEKFVEKVDLSEAGRILGDALRGLLDTFNEVFGDEKFWEDIGEDLQGFMEEIPWDSIVETAWNLFLGAIKLFWTSTANTELGTFIRVTVGISLASKIAKVFTGKTVSQTIGSAFGQMFKKAIESGAESAGTAASTGALPALAKLAGLVGAAIGTFEATSVEVGASEKNFTASGVFKEIYDNLEEIGTEAGLSQEQIDLLKQKFDGLSDSRSAVDVIEGAATAFGNFGISAESVKSAMSGDMDSNLGAVATRMEEISTNSATAKTNVESVSSTAQQATLDLSSYGNGTAQWSGNVYAVVDELAGKYKDFGHNVDDLRYSFENQYQGTESAQEAYDLLRGVVEDTGGSVSTLNKAFKEEFPNAVEIGTQSVNTSVQTSETKVTDGFTKMKTIATGSAAEIRTKSAYDFKEAEKAITGSVQTSEKETGTSFGGIESKITSVNAEVSKDTDTQFDSLKTSAVKHVSDMKDTLNNKVTEISVELHNRFTTIADTLPNHFKDIGTDIAAHFSNVASLIESTINSGNNLELIGIDIIASIQRGLTMNPLKLPHIVQDPWNPWSTFNNGQVSFTTPNFKVDWYAKGGLFTTPTLAGFGEAGDEAALPLTNKGVMSRIANAIIDNGDGFGGMTQEDMVEAVATGVAMAMSQNPQTVEVIVNSVIKTNDEKLAQAVARGKARLDQRYNATPVTAR